MSKLKKPSVNKDTVREVLINILLCALYLWFAYRYAMDFMVHERYSSLILLVFESLVAGFFLFRRLPVSYSVDPLEWFCAILGTWLPLAFRPAPVVEDVLLLQIIQITGLVIAMSGLVFLRRSFGIVPANRGIQAGGMYRVVRHPMYAGYILMYIGYVLQNFTIYNIALFSGVVLFKIIRIVMEEAHLSSDPAYQDLKARVKYRLIPFVW